MPNIIVMEILLKMYPKFSSTHMSKAMNIRYYHDSESSGIVIHCVQCVLVDIDPFIDALPCEDNQV